MRNKWMMSLVQMPLVLMLLLVPVVSAQMPDPQMPDSDRGADPGPGPGVAHISIMNGEVTTQRGDSGDWIASAPNAPLLAGDRIYSPRGARAEVQFDGANFFRIGQDTEVQLADVAAGHYQLQVSKGILSYSLVRDARSQAEIDTPTVAVRPLQPGLYRVEVFADGQTRITVRAGRAEVSSQQGSEAVNAGQMLMVRSDGPGGEIQVQELGAAAPDEWDRWNEQRDGQLARAVSPRYVDPSIAGTEDLDTYGNWQQVPEYGQVWYPRVEPGWSPYSYGRWSWTDGYGWSWVDYDPWGWAPFHYGRWFFRGGFGWGWWPGPVGVPCYWSPALVGFFGWGGGHGGFGFGYGNIGWVPLAPHERMSAWWGRGFGGRASFNNVRVTNINNITNVYHNAGVNGGIRSIGAQQFGQGGIVRHQAVSAASIGQAGQVHGMAPVVPTHNSLQVSNRPVNSNALPRGDTPNRFFSTRQSSAVQRTPFTQQQQQAARAFGNGASLQNGVQNGSSGQNGGAGFSNRPSLRPQGFNAQGSNAQAPNGSQGGWRQLGQGGQVSGATLQGRPAPPAGNAAPQGVTGNPGWRRLGESGQQQFNGSANGGGYSPMGRQPAAGNMQGYQGAPVNHGTPYQPAPRQFEAPRTYSAPAPSYSRPAPQQSFGGSTGGGRQLQIQRPIMTPRQSYAPVNQGGGGGSFGGGHGGGGGGHSSGGNNGGGGHGNGNGGGGHHR